MTEQEDVLADLGEAGVLAGLRWAGTSAAQRTWRDYDAPTGHEQGWIGYNNYVLLRNRLDRVFSCGPFAVSSADLAHDGQDFLMEGLTHSEFETMPVIPPDLVIRDDLNGSPAWRYRNWRWLLQSFKSGEVNRISWHQKSPTKESVAGKANPDQQSLFDTLGLEIAEPPAIDHNIVIVDLIMAHSVNALTGANELYFGHARSVANGGDSWFWRFNLLSDPPTNPGSLGGYTDGPVPPSNDPVPDATVRLRPKAGEGAADDAIG